MTNYEAEKLVTEIVKEINADDLPYEKKGIELINYYENASGKEKGVVNELFVMLTGWTFDTILLSLEGE